MRRISDFCYFGIEAQKSGKQELNCHRKESKVQKILRKIMLETY